VLHAWHEATGLEIRDGYGQTETGQLTGMPLGEPARPGSMGRALPGVELSVQDGELVADPASVPTFFLGYLGEGVERRDDGTWRIEERAARRTDRVEGVAGEASDGGPGGSRCAPGADGPHEDEPWHTGDRVHEDDEGYLWFEGRSDDVIVSAGYRIGPFEVESALVAHPAVAEAAAVAAPDPERGAVVRAVVVLRDGFSPTPALARELQDHVKRETAPYKYPRIIDFAPELPKTASGKVRRAALRGET
jgi:acetyl-CoA synthetase